MYTLPEKGTEYINIFFQRTYNIGCFFVSKSVKKDYSFQVLLNLLNSTRLLIFKTKL